MRIPLKWGTKYGDVGQRRSGATLVTAMISEVPHLSQGFVIGEGKQHHFVSIISFLSSARSARSGAGFRWEVGHDDGACGAWLKWGNLFWLLHSAASAQIISGERGSAGMPSVVGAGLRFCNQRFSISSILCRIYSQ